MDRHEAHCNACVEAFTAYQVCSWHVYSVCTISAGADPVAVRGAAWSSLIRGAATAHATGVEGDGHVPVIVPLPSFAHSLFAEFCMPGMTLLATWPANILCAMQVRLLSNAMEKLDQVYEGDYLPRDGEVV